VSKSLTLQYDKALYLLDDTPGNRALAGRYAKLAAGKSATPMTPPKNQKTDIAI